MVMLLINCSAGLKKAYSRALVIDGAFIVLVRGKLVQTLLNSVVDLVKKLFCFSWQ